MLDGVFSENDSLLTLLYIFCLSFVKNHLSFNL